jgi:hypothetical protein
MLDSNQFQDGCSCGNGDSPKPASSPVQRPKMGGKAPSTELPAKFAWLATSRKHSFPHYLLSLGWPPELVAATTVEVFVTLLKREFREQLRRIGGEKWAEDPGPSIELLVERAARIRYLVMSALRKSGDCEF